MKREKMVRDSNVHIAFRVWDDVESPKGVVQIVHGMCEHMGRYEDFAAFLNKNGWIVAGDDHRAHGETASADQLGQAPAGDIFTDTVQDVKQLTEQLKEEYKLPVVVIGHSYGSILMQLYMAMGTENVSGVILSGSTLMEGLRLAVGYRTAFKLCQKDKGALPGTKFSKSTFDKYDKKVGGAKNSWLSRDEEQVKKYNDDPMCGFACSNSFYKFMLGGMKNILRDKGGNIPKDFKLMIASGSMDGFGGYGKSVQKLYERYKGFGLEPQLKLYEGARHELLNETNRQEVYDDFLAFANSCI